MALLQRSFRQPEHIPHRALVWIIFAQLAATASHYAILPVWLLLFAVISTAWCLFIYYERLPAPGRFLKLLLMVASVGVFVVLSKAQFTIENAVAFFVLTYCLKMLEMQKRRDAYIFSFMSIFLLSLGFLFSQAIGKTLYVVLTMTLGLQSLVLLNLPTPPKRYPGLGKLVLVMAGAVPLLLFMYIAFPRFGPLWAMPLKSETGFTGLDDRVAPGDVANLAQSPERAFRVSFRSGEPPTPSKRYWRALILDEMEGAGWQRSFLQVNLDRQRNDSALTPPEEWDYEIILDPHNRTWGFAFDPLEVSGMGAALTPDGLVRFGDEVKSPKRYRVETAGPSQGKSAPLSTLDRRRFTRLPSNTNPQAREFAARLAARHTSPSALVEALLNHFNKNAYFYTLSPPLLTPSNRIDDFLFNTQRGFCEHFANATAFLLRSAGIPARLVTGYQGGEWNGEGRFLVIHQYDAHAWVEAWLPGQGWTLVDPTAAVAPDRIQQGIREAVAQEGSFLQDAAFSLAKFNDIPTLAWLRNKMEYVNYLWVSNVVNYDNESQRSLYKRLFGEFDWKQVSIIFAAGFVGIFLVMGVWAMWPRLRKRRKGPSAQIYDYLYKQLLKRKLAVHPGMTINQMLKLLARKQPAKATAIAHLQGELNRELYASEELSNRDSKHLRSRIRKMLSA